MWNSTLYVRHTAKSPSWHHWLLIWHKVLVVTITYKWIMDKRDGPTNNISHMGFILESINPSSWTFCIYILYIIYGPHRNAQGHSRWALLINFWQMFCCTKSSYFFSWNGGIGPPFKWTHVHGRRGLLRRFMVSGSGHPSWVVIVNKQFVICRWYYTATLINAMMYTNVLHMRMDGYNLFTNFTSNLIFIYFFYFYY